jgi:hypothetical protein
VRLNLMRATETSETTPGTDSVILSVAKDLGNAGEASFAGATDLSFADQMLHFVQHDGGGQPHRMRSRTSSPCRLIPRAAE